MTRSRLQEIAALARRRERDRQGAFLIEGVRAVESAIEAGAALVDIVVSHEAGSDGRVRSIVDHAGASVAVVSAKDVERVSDARTSQGVVAVARSVVRDFDPAMMPAAPIASVVLLDAIQDPGNVGTIIRTAAWFGIDAVIIGPGTADPESPKVTRAAAGALWDVSLYRANDLGRTADQLTAAGFTLCGADASGSSLDDWNPAPRTAVVLGGEGGGISTGVSARLAEHVGIAPAARGSGVESLNVAVAAGILLHHWSRSINGPGPGRR